MDIRNYPRGKLRKKVGGEGRMKGEGGRGGAKEAYREKRDGEVENIRGLYKKRRWVREKGGEGKMKVEGGRRRS